MLIKKGLLCCAVSIFFLIVSGVAFAEEPAQNEKWEIGAEIYLWGASIGGQTNSGSNVNIDFDDLVDDLQMGFMGILEARKGKWSLLADVIYLDVEADKTVSGVPVSVELTGWILTPAVGYTVLAADWGHLDLLGGARYLDLDSDLRLGALSVDAGGDGWDGIVGVRGKVNLAERWYLPYYLDVGAGNADMTWQGSLGVGYRLNRFDIVAGYRYLDWNFDDSGVFDDLNLSGPYLGARFTF